MLWILSYNMATLSPSEISSINETIIGNITNNDTLDDGVNFYYHPIITKTLIWFGVTIIGAIVTRLTLISVRCRHSPLLSSAFVVESHGDYDAFQIQHRPDKSSNDIFRDATTICVNAMLQLYFANVLGRINLNSTSQVRYTIPYILSIVGIGILGEIRGLQTSVSSGSISQWSRTSWATYLSALLVVLGTFSYNIYRSIAPKETFYYLFSIVAIAVYYGIIYTAYFRDYGKIHLHHWWIGHMLGFYFRYDSIWNNIMSMIVYGISIQGIVAYGADHIFQDNSIRRL